MSRALLLALPLLGLGCSAVGGYLRDRGADAADVLKLQGSVGLGLAADAKLGDALHLGLGYADVRKAGFSGRAGVWLRDREVGFPVSLLLWVGALRDGRVSRLGHLHANVDELWHLRPARWGEVEAGVFLGVLGVRVGVSLIELADLLAGLVGFDPLADDRGLEPPPAELPEEGGQWLVGDLHDHCRPPDRARHATSSPEESAELAATNGLDFVGINPHLWNSGRLLADGEHAEFVAELQRLAERDDLPLLIPGFEATFRRGVVHWGPEHAVEPGDVDPHLLSLPKGHALILFPTLDELALHMREAEGLEREQAIAQWLALPRDRRLWIPTHPLHERLAVPFFPDWAADWPGVASPPMPRLLRARADAPLRAAPAADAAAIGSATPGQRWVGVGSHDGWVQTYRPGDVVADAAGNRAHRIGWLPDDALEERPEDQPFRGIFDAPLDGLEAISGILHLAEAAVGRGDAERAQEQVFATLDARIQRDRRRYTVTAGSDNHRDLILPTLWVFARERSTRAVFEALRLGRVCVGGEEARWFRARTDREPAWRYVGAALTAEREVELRWRGAAELFVDGVSQGTLRDGFVHTIEPDSFHAYRIVSGPSHSAWIYANLPE